MVMLVLLCSITKFRRRCIINIQLPKALKTGCPSCNRTTIDNCSMSSLSLLTASYSSWSKLCTFTNKIWWTRPPWNHGNWVRVLSTAAAAQDEAIFPAQETSCLCFDSITTITTITISLFSSLSFAASVTWSASHWGAAAEQGSDDLLKRGASAWSADAMNNFYRCLAHSMPVWRKRHLK